MPFSSPSALQSKVSRAQALGNLSVVWGAPCTTEAGGTEPLWKIEGIQQPWDVSFLS